MPYRTRINVNYGLAAAVGSCGAGLASFWSLAPRAPAAAPLVALAVMAMLLLVASSRRGGTPDAGDGAAR